MTDGFVERSKSLVKEDAPSFELLNSLSKRLSGKILRKDG